MVDGGGWGSNATLYNGAEPLTIRLQGIYNIIKHKMKFLPIPINLIELQ